ncbi:hypothetical protein HPP92_004369 [Vanilla planifolia]|uniref:Uncharacterized protein n=1 Tax=Vanilla planifolia TaxID=51239 RepID=A0A835RZB6_VANPL|nr:hypothetical protein HPP92_004369 [Vanilla planifolia]
MASSLLRFSDRLMPLPSLQCPCRLFRPSCPCVAAVCYWRNGALSSENLLLRLLCSHNNGSDSIEVEAGSTGDVYNFPQQAKGLDKENGKHFGKGSSSKELMQKLKRYGVAGVLSYGLLNTVYYLSAFLFVWFYFAPAPGRMGYAAAVKRVLKVMTMVWAGSQITKILRATGALALAPSVARGLSWFAVKFKFQSEGKAFAAIAGMCFGVAILLFVFLTVLWA